MKKKLFYMVLLGLNLFAAPGDLDTTFNPTGAGSGIPGVVFTNLGTTIDKGFAIAIQADNKIILAGQSYDLPSYYYNFALARYNTNGSLDTSFGTGGFVETSFGIILALAIQDDGKIIAGGDDPFVGDGDFIIRRYNTDGSLDSSFGVGGTVMTDFGTLTDSLNDLVIQTDGKIIAVGFSFGAPVALARYNLDGSLDTSFGVGGKVILSIPGGIVGALALQQDGKIVGGGGIGPFPTKFLLVRFNSDGSLDTSFGVNGFAITGFTGNAFVRSLLIQPNDKIIAVGGAFEGSTSFDFAIARFNSDGSLDTSFGSGGKIVTDLGGSDIAYGVVLQEDNKIVLGGTTVISGDEIFSLARYNADGSLDTTFGTGGKVVIPFMDDNEARGLLIQPDGKLVLGGTHGSYPYDFAIARYNNNVGFEATINEATPGIDAGKLNSDFGNNGIAIEGLAGDDGANALIVQFDGKIVIGGSASSGSNPENFGLVRFNRDGTIDNSFGNNGFIVSDFGDGADFINALAMQTDGKIIAGGLSSTNSNPDNFGLARYNTDGSLDLTFGNSGFVTTDFGVGDDSLNALVVQSDGKIIAAGVTANEPNASNFGLVRYNTDGSLDLTFGPDGTGLVVTDFGQADVLRALALQSDGKIIAVGDTFAGDNPCNFAFARYNSDGTLDTSFGVDGTGLVIIDVENGFDGALAIALQKDGKIVAAGKVIIDSDPSRFAIIRLNTDGFLDDTFGDQGIVTTKFDTGNDEARSITIQPDGKLLVAGVVDALSITGRVGVARYNKDGSLDSSFGDGGKVIVDTGLDNDRANAIEITANGDLIAAGLTNSGQDPDNFLLVNLNTNVVISKAAQAIFAKYSQFPAVRNKVIN